MTIGKFSICEMAPFYGPEAQIDHVSIVRETIPRAWTFQKYCKRYVLSKSKREQRYITDITYFTGLKLAWVEEWAMYLPDGGIYTNVI